MAEPVRLDVTASRPARVHQVPVLAPCRDATVTAGRTFKLHSRPHRPSPVIWIIVVLSTHAARGNEQLV